VCHLCDRTRDHNARVAKYNVDMAEATECLIRKVNYLVEMADVSRDTLRVKPLGAQVRHSLFQRGLIDVCKHDTRSAAGELDGGGETDATRTAGDDRASPFEKPIESVHEPPRYFRQLPASMGSVTPVM
jgi:hypothetical protein